MECLHASWQGWAGQTPEMHSSHCKWTQKTQCQHNSLKQDQASRRGQTLWNRHGLTFFWSRHGPEERCKAGVGFAVRSMLVGKLAGLPKGVNNCLMMMRLPFFQWAEVYHHCQHLCTHHDQPRWGHYEDLNAIITTVSSADKLSAPMHPPWPTQMRSLWRLECHHHHCFQCW